MSSPHSTHIPLAERMRPRTFDEFIGQADIVGEGKLLRKLIQNDELSSLIFWGPPGVGKTTLANIIAEQTGATFVVLSAVESGKKDLKEVVEAAKEQLEKDGKRTILFVDEIHRWNKAQQDALLPFVEKGIITLIGATTENPSFEIIGALLSRSRVFILKSLTTLEIVKIIEQAMADKERGLGDYEIKIETETIEMLAELSGGDARVALNTLELAVKAKSVFLKKESLASQPSSRPLPNPPLRGEGNVNVKKNFAEQNFSSQQTVPPPSRGRRGGGLSEDRSAEIEITKDDIKEALQRRHLVFDKKGEEFYNAISALHKSMRGSDANASLYWLARMLEGGADPLYIARRVVRFASEDVGMANSEALIQSNAAYDACHKLGMPECAVHLAQAVVYCAKSKKSNLLYHAYGAAAKDARETSHLGVPIHLRNAPTKFMKDIGYGKDYKYNPNYEGDVAQEYFPKELGRRNYLQEVDKKKDVRPL